MENEIWKDIEEYEGLYEVSNLGKVRNKRTGKILKPWIDVYGYYCASLWQIKIQRKKRYKIHRLVAIAFIQNEREDYKMIDHINRDKTDNRVTNLRWVNNSINSINKDLKSTNKSGKTGVYYDKSGRRWGVTISIEGKKKYKYFSTFEEASNARDELEKIYYKKYLNLN